jgi:glycosyltransferase involved in cell wall biosynthesis
MPPRLRVLSVAQSYYPYLWGGGRPDVVRNISEALVERGWDPTVLTAEFEAITAPLGDTEFRVQPDRFGHRAHRRGVEVVYLRTLVEYRYVTLNPGLFAYCREELPKADVVHIYGIYDFLGPVVAAYCRRHGIPYVLEPLGMFRPITRSILLKRAFRAAIAGRMESGAARVIATSDSERRELVAEGVAPERIVVRRNGIDRPARAPEGGRFRARHGIPDDAFVFFFLGRLIAKKSPDLLLRAFARAAERHPGASRRWRLVIAGPQEGERLGDALPPLASQFGVADRTVFLGPIYGDEKWEAYRDADVFVLPSQSENFGNTVGEAIACGTPAIVTDRCGIAEWVADARERAGVVVPYDEGTIAEALACVATDGALYASLRTACPAIARRLGWEEPAAELDALYRSIVAGRRVATRAPAAAPVAS